MATVFGASLSPMEREAQLIFMECDMTASKIEAIQDITNAQYDRAIMAAEYTVLKTGGTYDDLDRLMMEAAAQQGEKKVGIIRTILNSIGSAISSIGNWIQRNLGANNDRLNGLPANAQGDVDGYDLKAANEGLTGLPKVFNKLKEIIKGIQACIQGNKEFAIASVAVAAVAAVLVKGSKEEQEAKEEPITKVNKETAQDMLNRYLKLQGTANELTGEVDTLLKKLGLPMKALKAKAEDIATKKNAKRAEKEAQSSGGDQQQQQAQPTEGEKKESVEDYGLSAYDGLFMEANNNRDAKYHYSDNPYDKQKTQSEPPKTGTQGTQTGSKPTDSQKSEPPKDDTSGKTDTQSTQTGSTETKSEPPKTGTQGTQTGSKPTDSQKSEPPKDDTSGKTDTQSTQTGSTETKSEPPKTDTQTSGAKEEQKDQTQNGGDQQQAAPADNGNAQAETESEFSKLPWYDKAITVLQATLETMLALVAATGKAVLNIVAKVIQWDKIKAGANKLEQRVMDGRGGGKEDNNQEGQDEGENQGGDQNGQNTEDANADNGSESAHEDVTGDYTTESPDLFGIHDEYNEMMGSPSIEELNSFEAIFDNL